MTTTNRPTFILGIHHFCDHRCWRCELSTRCAVFARWEEALARGPAPTEPASRLAAILSISLEVTMDEAAMLFARGSIKPARGGETVEPVAVPEDDDRVERATRDPLVARGAEYARLSWPVLRAQRPALERRGDKPAADAALRLEEMCATLASKIFRAVSSSLDPDYRSSDLQSDANGSAKVALLLIEESRQAWRELMQPDRAYANGLPARAVLLLEDLESDLLQRFPRALEFVRPGFDTGDAEGSSAQLARALLDAGRMRGTA